MKSVLETALVEEFDSGVFVPDDHSSESIGHVFNTMLGAIRLFPAASWLINGALGLQFVELIKLVLFKTFCKYPHIYIFFSFCLLAEGYIGNFIEFLEF